MGRAIPWCLTIDRGLRTDTLMSLYSIFRLLFENHIVIGQSVITTPVLHSIVSEHPLWKHAKCVHND